MPTLSIVIPVFNEERTIGEVIQRVLATDVGNLRKEVIVANDGSADRTREILEAGPWATDDRVHLVHSPVNFGKGAAVRLALAHASGDIVLIQDADLELDPQQYGALLVPILEGSEDVVYGSRFLVGSPNIPRLTRLANWVLTALTNMLFRARLTDMETAYKVFRRSVLESVSLRAVGFDIEPEITARIRLAGYRIHEVPVRYSPRGSSEGKKIRWIDGVDAAYMLVKCRLTAAGTHVKPSSATAVASEPRARQLGQ